jgi:multimeric flavodoxin WrbA
MIPCPHTLNLITEKKMKILAISCSPNGNGNTVKLLNQALSGASHEGAETELFTLSGKSIEPCRGCRTCWTTGKCVIDDDMAGLLDKMVESDGFILGAPIYFYSINAQCKTIIDRTGPLGQQGKSIANKVGAAVITAGSLGLIDALKDIYFYFVTRQVVPANYVAAYAAPGGEVSDLPKCMAAAFDIGRQMVQIASQKFRYPQGIERARIAFGTHTK